MWPQRRGKNSNYITVSNIWTPLMTKMQSIYWNINRQAPRNLMGITTGLNKLLNTAINFDNPVDLCQLSSVSCLALFTKRKCLYLFRSSSLALFFLRGGRMYGRRASHTNLSIRWAVLRLESWRQVKRAVSSQKYCGALTLRKWKQRSVCDTMVSGYQKKRLRWDV